MFYMSKKTKEKMRSTDEGRKSFASLLPKFSMKNALSFGIKRIQIEGQDLEITLNNSNAFYHYSCKNAYNNKMYKRQLEKEERSSNLESEDILKNHTTKRRLSTASNEVTSGQGICCFANVLIGKKTLLQQGHSMQLKPKHKLIMQKR